jgi:surface antigen
MRVAGLVIAFTALFTGITATTSSAITDTPLCTNYEQCSQTGRSDHGYASVEYVGHWGMYGGHNCTNYVAYMLGRAGVAQPDYGLGNAADWGPAAAAHGVDVDGVPSVGAVAWWSGGAGGLSWAGHVAWVEQVTPGSITISEDNYPGGPFDWRVIPVGSPGWPTGFLHFSVPLGPQEPSIATATGGATAVAAVRTDRSLVLSTRARPEEGWTTRVVAPAGSAWSAPALVLGAGGLVEIAVRGPAGSLAVYDRASGRSSWTVEQVTGPNAIVGAPSAALAPGGELQVAARAADGNLELFAAAPHATIPVAAAPHAAGVTGARGPLRRWTTTVLAGPGSVLSRPAMTVAADGTADIAVVGPGHSLVLHTGRAGGLWAVRTVSGPNTAFADPSVLEGVDGRLQIATIGPHRTAQVHVADGLQWSVRALSAPGLFSETPDLVPAAPGTVSAAVTGSGGAVSLTAATVPAPATTRATIAARGAAVQTAPAGDAVDSAAAALRVERLTGRGTVALSPTDVTWAFPGIVEVALVASGGRLEILTRTAGGAVTTEIAGPAS